jgi:glycosyltransferase involved in cell wall biosynthesis
VEVLTTNINGSGKSAVPVGVPVDLDGVQVRYFSSDVLTRLSWAPALSRALRQEIGQLDLVHLHSVFLWPTWAAAGLAVKAQVPYLVSPRGMLVKELLERRSRLVKAAWIRLIERANLERAAAIHVTSELEGSELARFNWRLPDVATIANGVDEPEHAGEGVSSDVRDVFGGRPFALFFGRLSWKKGLDRLLQAFANTKSGRLAIVGPDDEQLVGGLAQLATGLGIVDRVRFLPRTVTGRDKEHLLASARVFVLPSYSENFGNTVLEAMRRGVPVVVTPEVGAAEIVRKAGGGLVVDGAPLALGEAMNRLLEDAALAGSMGQAGQRHVCAHYTWDRIAARMEALYERLKSGLRSH